MINFETYILIVVITSVFFGGVIKGSVGIGLSMFSVPIIAFFLPPTTAVMFLCFPILTANFFQMKVQKGIGSYRFLPMFIALVIGLFVGSNLILKINLSTISQIIAISIIFLVFVNFGFETPANASMREPHGKGAAKPRKKQQKRPRSFWHDGKHHIVK